MTRENNGSYRWLALNAAFVAVGSIGAGTGAMEVLKAQARTARKVIPRPTSRPFDGDGLYRPGAARPLPWRPGMDCQVHLAVFGDSLAAGLGAETPGELPGVLIARGLAELSGWDVRLSTKAIVGASSLGLAGQIEAMQIAGGTPDVAVVLIGGNDITARNGIAPSARRLGEAVRLLVAERSHVVVGTCPDLGTVRPIPQPLRAVLHTMSVRLAAAQAVQVHRAGGSSVSLTDALAPEFLATPEAFFSPDQFHPNSAGYELVAGLILPSVAEALGVGTRPETTEHPATEHQLAARGSTAMTFPVEPRPGPVVTRLTRRLTEFVRTHDDGAATTGRHNGDVDTADTADARRAADRLRTLGRFLRRQPARAVEDAPAAPEA